MQTLNLVLTALVSLSIGFATAQNVQTTTVTELQQGVPITVTEIASIVGTQGSTQIEQIKMIALGQTVTESIFISPSEIVDIEDSDNNGISEHAVLDCKFNSAGLATCVQSASDVEAGVTTLVIATTFVTQIVPPTPAPSPPPSSQKPPPASSPAPSSNKPSSNPAQPSPTNSPANGNGGSSSQSSASSQSPAPQQPGAASSSSSTTTPTASPSPTAPPAANSPAASNPVASSINNSTDGPATVTDPLPTNPPPAQDNGSMGLITAHQLGVSAVLVVLGLALGMV